MKEKSQRTGQTQNKFKRILNKFLIVLKLLLELPVLLLETGLRYFPGSIGIYLRYFYYKLRLKYLGKKVIIEEGVYLINPKNISIDDNTWITKNVILLSGDPSENLGERKYLLKVNKNYKGNLGELKIGKNCHIAQNVIIQAHGGVVLGDGIGMAFGAKILSMSHHYRNMMEEDGKIYKYSSKVPFDEQFIIIGAVIMESNTVLGLNSVIMPNVTIGINSVIGVNSCVVHDIPPNSIAKGNPAEVFKKRVIF